MTVPNQSIIPIDFPIYSVHPNVLYLLLDYRILIVFRLQLGTQMYFYVPRLILEIFSLLLLYWILHTLIWNDFEIILQIVFKKAKSGGFSPWKYILLFYYCNCHIHENDNKYHISQQKQQRKLYLISLMYKVNKSKKLISCFWIY